MSEDYGRSPAVDLFTQQFQSNLRILMNMNHPAASMTVSIMSDPLPHCVAAHYLRHYKPQERT